VANFVKEDCIALSGTVFPDGPLDALDFIQLSITERIPYCPLLIPVSKTINRLPQF